jgi:hypothetical protein
LLVADDLPHKQWLIGFHEAPVPHGF